MAKKTEKKEEKKVLTRAEKNVGAQEIVKELLAVKPLTHNELIEEASKLYTKRFGEGDEKDVHGVKGRIGSVVNNMEKESVVMEDGGRYALKARIMPMPAPVLAEEEKPVKKTKKTTKKAENAPVEELTKEEKPKKTTRKKAVKTEEQAQVMEEKPAPKKRGRKPKAVKEETVEEKKEDLPVLEEEKPFEKAELIVKEKAEVMKQPVVMDMSFLFGEPKQKAVKKEEKAPVKADEKAEKDAPVSKPKEEKPVEKTEKIVKTKLTPPQAKEKKPSVKKMMEKPMTADEKLRDAFLKKMRTLGGDYFEYYSVYLLERYSRRNGRRLEGLKITGGDHDGGIDGEIELTDRLGFRETIYIQSKNWNPDKGKEESWVVGETLLQQFIGACACKQAKDGKQRCRGIFITTSRFTPEAKRILDDMSEKIVGYDGNDLYETAKECEFGVVKRNGEWVLDEKLLSGVKAFFQMT